MVLVIVVEMVVVRVQVVVDVVVDVEGGVLVEVVDWKLISRAEQLIETVLHDWPAVKSSTKLHRLADHPLPND